MGFFDLLGELRFLGLFWVVKIIRIVSLTRIIWMIRVVRAVSVTRVTSVYSVMMNVLGY